MGYEARSVLMVKGVDLRGSPVLEQVDHSLGLRCKVRDPRQAAGLLASGRRRSEQRGECRGADTDTAATKKLPPRGHLLVLFPGIHL